MSDEVVGHQFACIRDGVIVGWIYRMVMGYSPHWYASPVNPETGVEIGRHPTIHQTKDQAAARVFAKADERAKNPHARGKPRRQSIVSDEDGRIDAVIEAARKAQPVLWNRMEAVARVIDPGAYAEVQIDPPDRARRYAVKQRYMRAIALHTAQQVLQVLGVNTETDWLAVMAILADQDEK